MSSPAHLPPLSSGERAGRLRNLWPLSIETDREVWTVLLLASVGGLAIAFMVDWVHALVSLLQTALFGAAIDSDGGDGIARWRLLVVPILGSLVLGGVLVFLDKRKLLAITDPVEANALEGGRMSASQTLIFVGLSTISISIGGSVGFEAAMSQLGAGLLSVIGQKLGLPRRALRCLVACGTAAGIAAIFDAPLTGTIYALELVIGGYGVRALLPTLLAGATSGLVTHFLVGPRPIFLMPPMSQPELWHYTTAIGLAVAGSIVGIAVMRGATGFEALLARRKVPKLLRPLAGGVCLGVLAFVAWQVIGPGHLVLQGIIRDLPAPGWLAVLLVAKIAASVVCVGSGFRGGLFSASLLIGGILGALAHVLVIAPIVGPSASPELSIAVGMTAVCASVIGTPVAILILAIETTGLHVGIVAVALGVVIASHLTRRWFGYSFSTWKFHLRGQDLSGPRDIGRLKELTFADAPLIDPPRLLGEERIGDVARKRADWVAAEGFSKPEMMAIVTEQGGFVGFLRHDRLIEAAAETPDLPVAMIADHPKACARVDDPLSSQVEISEAAFGGWFAVVDRDDRLVGFAPEAAVLRRYLSELKAADQDDTAPFPPRPR